MKLFRKANGKNTSKTEGKKKNTKKKKKRKLQKLFDVKKKMMLTK